MDVLCELYPVKMTAIFASKRIFAAAATGGARTAELPTKVCQMSTFLRQKLLHWYGHVRRREADNLTRKVMDMDITGKRRGGDLN